MYGRSRETVMKPSLLNHHSLKKYHEEADIDYAFEMCRLVLRPLGVWSLIYNRASKWEKAVSVVLMVTFTFCLLSLIVSLSCQIILGDTGGKARIRWFGSAFNCWTSLLKYMYIVLRRSTFTRCIELMEKDWRTVKNEQHRELMVKQATFSRTLIMLCCGLIFGSILMFHVILPLSKRRVAGNHTAKALAYPGYDRFFDVQSSPTYEIIYSVQCFAGLFRFNITVGVFSLAVFFITHICGQMQIQIMRLEELNIASPEKNSDHYAIIGDIIQNHTEILRYAKVIGDSFSELIFLEIMGGTFMICIAEYGWLMVWKASRWSDTIAMTTYSVFMLSLMSRMLIFCYVGQVLTDQCAQIGFAGYEFDWYNLPPPKARDLVLLDAISLYPPTFIGGKLCELSLNTFTIILKTSMVYLNFMRAVTYL